MHPFNMCACRTRTICTHVHIVNKHIIVGVSAVIVVVFCLVIVLFVGLLLGSMDCPATSSMDFKRIPRGVAIEAPSRSYTHPHDGRMKVVCRGLRGVV